MQLIIPLFVSCNRTLASPNGWVHLEGKMLLDHTPAKAAAYIEGPPAGIDLFIKRFSIFSVAKDPPIRPTIKVRSCFFLWCVCSDIYISKVGNKNTQVLCMEFIHHMTII